MKIDSNTVTIVIAVCAIFSPLLTTFINNFYSLKMKKMDIQAQKEKDNRYYRIGIFENFFQSAYRCVALSTRENINEYYEKLAILRIHVPSDLSPKLNKVSSVMAKNDWETARHLLDEFSNEVHEYIITEVKK